VVNFSSCEYKRLIRDDHFVTIGSYAQGYPLGLWKRKMQGEFLVRFAVVGLVNDDVVIVGFDNLIRKGQLLESLGVIPFPGSDERIFGSEASIAGECYEDEGRKASISPYWHVRVIL